jgi:hypothetical protein
MKFGHIPHFSVLTSHFSVQVAGFVSNLLEDPVRFKRIKRSFYAGLAALALGEVAAPLLFYTDRAHFSFEDLPAWGAIYGLVSCAAIIVLSKLLGKLWLMRQENYYDA